MDPVTLGMAKADAAKRFARIGQGSIGKVAQLQTKVLTNFAPSHGWTTFSAGGATVTLNDTSDHAYGSQCIRVVTGGAG